MRSQHLFLVFLVVLALVFSFNFVIADKYKTDINGGNIETNISSNTTEGNGTGSNESNNSDSHNSNSGNSGSGSSGGGSNNIVQETKTAICHIPPGNPNNAHTIYVGGKAPTAHSKHGDTLGPCEGDQGNQPEGNNTDTNQTEVNLTLSIVSPLNITYNMTEILINISSNGDNIWYSLDGDNNSIYNGSFIQNFSEGTHTLDAFVNNTNENLSISVMFNVNLTIMDANMTDINITDVNNTIPDTNQTNNETNLTL